MLAFPHSRNLTREVPHNPMVALIPTTIGCFSSMMGIGGGTFSVMALTLFNVPIHRAVGTAALLGLVISLPGTVGFIVAGWGDPRLPPGSPRICESDRVCVNCAGLRTHCTAGCETGTRLRRGETQKCCSARFCYWQPFDFSTGHCNEKIGNGVRNVPAALCLWAKATAAGYGHGMRTLRRVECATGTVSRVRQYMVRRHAWLVVNLNRVG